MLASVRCPQFTAFNTSLSSRSLISCSHFSVHSTCRQRRGKGSLVRVRAAEDGKQEFGLQAPAKPKTPYGEMLTYYLKMEPQLFKTAVEDQLKKLHEEKEAQAAAAAAAQSDDNSSTPQASNGELVLYKRMQELRSVEVRATLEDLMYVSILEKFSKTGVDMLPRMDGMMIDAPVNLVALTEGIHSREALELVREHLNAIMGPTAGQFSNVMLKMSKFQMAQVYAASVMFGYFLRRVDERFQLEKSMGTLPVTKEDAVARLERLFSIASADVSEDLDKAPETEVVDLDSPAPSSSSSTAGSSTGSKASTSGRGSSDSSSGKSGEKSPAKRGQSALRRYVDQFDQATMVETARIMSVEGSGLVERQTHALVGDIKALTKQIQEAVGTDATSMEEVMQRLAKAVETDKVDTLTMSVATQRRAVLEAVAFGSFMRDVESHIQGEYAGLLTPLAAPTLPPGMGGFGGGNGMGGGGGGGGGGGRGRRGGPGVKSGGDTLTM